MRFLIVQDYRENLRKCTALPLKDLPGFEILRLPLPVPREEPREIPGGLWLDVDAPVLEPGDRDVLTGDARVIVLDASWARVAPLERRLRVRDGAPLHRRSLPGSLRTAYPRRSKLFEDPAAGLATVEAVFTVTALLGEARREILETYRWAAGFLALNRSAFARLGHEIT